MAETRSETDAFELSDGVAGYLRDNPHSSDRFFNLMAQKAALEAPNKRATANPVEAD